MKNSELSFNNDNVTCIMHHKHFSLFFLSCNLSNMFHLNEDKSNFVLPTSFHIRGFVILFVQSSVCVCVFFPTRCDGATM